MGKLEEKLLNAAEKGDIEAMQTCLNEKADLNAKDSKRRTPLMIACIKGNLGAVNLLIQQEKLVFNLNDGRPNYFTAFMHAVMVDRKGSHREIIDTLFDAEKLLEDEKNIALIYYAGRGDIDKVKYCLSKLKCDVNFYHKNFRSSLIKATEEGQQRIVEILLEQPSININITNYLNETSLIIAIKKGYKKIAEQFLKREDVALHEQSFLLGTPLTASIFYEYEDLAIQLLAKDKDFTTLLHPRVLVCAVESGSVAITKALIEKGVDINATGEEGYESPEEWVWEERQPSPFIALHAPVFELPVIVAMKKNRIEILKLLIQKNVELNKKGTEGQSAVEFLNAPEISDDIKKILKDSIDKKQSQTLKRTKNWSEHRTSPTLFKPSADSTGSNQLAIAAKRELDDEHSLTAKGKTSVEKEAQTWDFQVNIPELFSFPMNEKVLGQLAEVKKILIKNIEFVNLLARSSYITMSRYEFNNLLNELDSDLKQANQLMANILVSEELTDTVISTQSQDNANENKALPEGKQEVLYNNSTKQEIKPITEIAIKNIFLLRLLVMESQLLYWQNKTDNRIEKIKEIVIFSANSQEKTEEIAWYGGTHLYLYLLLLAEWKKAYLDLLLDYTSNINSKNHREAIILNCLRYYKRSDQYPDYAPLEKIKHLMPEKTWEYEATCAQQRHAYVKKLIKNQEFFDFQKFFDFQTSPFLKEEFKPSKNFKTFISKHSSFLAKQTKIDTSISANDLLQFSAHAIPITSPKPLISIENIHADRLEQFNYNLRKKLQANGFCDENQGWVVTKKNHGQNKIIYQIPALENENKALISQLIAESLKENIDEFNTWNKKKQKEYTDNTANDLFKHKNQIIEFEKIKDRLSGFNNQAALMLYRECLIEHKYGLPKELLDQIREVVTDCLEISCQAKKIHSTIADLEKFDAACFELAGDIVKRIAETKKSLLFQVGTPIETGKNFSEHTFYIVLKCLPNDKIQIIITNGGFDAGKFHKVHRASAKFYKEYHYAAFEPFFLDEEHKVKLRHYIYKLLIISYIKTSNDAEYINVLKNIYLFQEINKEFFYGYKSEKITGFKRRDLEETFLAQFTGNCTVHNLRKAITMLFGMSALTRGLLDDVVALGLDQLATVLKSELKLSVLNELYKPEHPKNIASNLGQQVKPFKSNTLQTSQANLIWAPISIRDLFYPVLDKLSESFVALDIKIIKKSDKYLEMQSKQGWRLFSVKVQNEYWVSLDIHYKKDITGLLEAFDNDSSELFSVIILNMKNNNYRLIIQFPVGINFLNIVERIDLNLKKYVQNSNQPALNETMAKLWTSQMLFSPCNPLLSPIQSSQQSDKGTSKDEDTDYKIKNL